MEAARKRAGRGHIYRSVYVVIVFMAWPAGLALLFAPGLKRGEFPYAFPLLMLPVFPAVLWGLSAGVFRFPYSAFGAYERTPPPDEAPLLLVENSYGRIGWMRATVPFFAWAVYRDGLGFTIFGCGTGFVPGRAIRSIRVARGSARIDHDFPEVSSPIKVPEYVATALEAGEQAPPIPSAPRKPRFRLAWGVALFVVAFLLGISLFGYLVVHEERGAREEVLAFLERAGSEAEVVVLSGSPLPPADTARLLEALAGLEPVPGHGSHPLARFSVIVRRGEESLLLELGRDSKILREYWVYHPDRGWFTDYNEIGRIHTDLLDHVSAVGNAKPRRKRGGR